MFSLWGFILKGSTYWNRVAHIKYKVHKSECLVEEAHIGKRMLN